MCKIKYKYKKVILNYYTKLNKYKNAIYKYKNYKYINLLCKIDTLKDKKSK